MSFDEKERIANSLCGSNIFEIDGVVDYEYPTDLNAFVIVMESGKKYLVQVTEYTDDD